MFHYVFEAEFLFWLVSLKVLSGSFPPLQATQYSCNHKNLAPEGCTQFFYESSLGSFQSYNYNNGNGQHLANQDQQICVRCAGSRRRRKERSSTEMATLVDLAASHV